jgi:conjugal transfer pilus assembly protein TraV
VTRAAVALSLAVLAAAALGGCQGNVKGSWACAVDRGGVCASITDIDHRPARGGPQGRHDSIPADPVVDGSIPAKLWGEGGWSVGPLAGAPVRQGDQVMKVAVAPWIDQAGDYHAGSEVYAVMRRADWYAPRPSVSQRIELSVRRPSAEQARAEPPSPAPSAASALVAANDAAGQGPQLRGAPVLAAPAGAH